MNTPQIVDVGQYTIIVNGDGTALIAEDWIPFALYEYPTDGGAGTLRLYCRDNNNEVEIRQSQTKVEKFTADAHRLVAAQLDENMSDSVFVDSLMSEANGWATIFARCQKLDGQPVNRVAVLLVDGTPWAVRFADGMDEADIIKAFGKEIAEAKWYDKAIAFITPSQLPLFADGFPKGAKLAVL